MLSPSSLVRPVPLHARARRALLAPLCILVATGCGREMNGAEAHAPRSATDSLVAVAKARLDSTASADSQATSIAFAVKPRGRTLVMPHGELPDGDERIARALVFAPATQTWYLAAVRAKRLLVDLGRVDMEVRKEPAVADAYRRLVRQLSPVPAGSRLRLHGAWGTAEATVSGFDTWNGRIVATLTLPESLDSLARTVPSLVAAAELIALPGERPSRDSSVAAQIARVDSARADSAMVPRAACVRDSVPPLLLARADSVRDSVLTVLRATKIPTLERLAKSVTPYAAQARGCFGPVGRVAVVAGIRAGNNEYVQEQLLMIDSTGRATPLLVRDYRFKAHDQLSVLDADGDGIDDLAARGAAEAIGGTVILRLDPTAKRIERLTGGFSWESR